MRNYLFIVVFLFLLSGCKWFRSKYEGENAVARVKDRFLYFDDLKGLVPAGTPASDSVEIVTTYINSWIHQQLLIQLAENNLPKEKLDFERELELYRNSLVVYQYETELVRQKLDTVIKPEEIEAYYNTNQSQFRLRESIVRGKVIVVKKNTPQLPKIRLLIKSNKLMDKLTLAGICTEQSADAWLEDSTWVTVESLLQKMPANADAGVFLNSNKYIELHDSANCYLAFVTEYKVKEGISPLGFETQNIKAIILNKRKSQLIAKMEEDIFKEALEKKEFEIFGE